MGREARANPNSRQSQAYRMAYLREACTVLPRMAILEQLPKMREADRLIVLKMLDECQPESTS